MGKVVATLTNFIKIEHEESNALTNNVVVDNRFYQKLLTRGDAQEQHSDTKLVARSTIAYQQFKQRSKKHQLPYLYRGDDRHWSLIFKDGFTAKSPVISHPHDTGYFHNIEGLISFSSELPAAAFFPESTPVNSYVYLVKAVSVDSYFDRYSIGLTDIPSIYRVDTDLAASWVKERNVSAIPAKDVFCCLKVKRDHSTHRFKIVNIRVNTAVKLSRDDQRRINNLKKQIGKPQSFFQNAPCINPDDLSNYHRLNQFFLDNRAVDKNIWGHIDKQNELFHSAVLNRKIKPK